MRRLCLSLAAATSAAFVSVPAAADFLTPASWTRGDAYTTYQQWEAFASPGGPNPPNTTPLVPAAPHNPNGAANTVDTSGGSFVTGGGNIYSPSVATHIKVTVPEYSLGSDYVTTVLFQTRTQGSEPTYDGDAGYHLTYTDATGTHTLLPADRGPVTRTPLGGFGGFLVDYSVVFHVPGSPAELAILFDASSSSMSLDRVAVDTVVTRAAAGAPLPGGMIADPGFVSQPVPEPAAFALVGVAGLLLARRRSVS